MVKAFPLYNRKTDEKNVSRYKIQMLFTIKIVKLICYTPFFTEFNERPSIFRDPFTFRAKEVNVEFICVDNPGGLSQDDLQVLNDAAKGIQRAQRITGAVNH